jgi:hypothetical protein
MRALSLKLAANEGVERELARLELGTPSWVLVYGVEDAPLGAVIAEVRRRHPRARVFGATSSQGVFSPDGFERGIAMLVGEPHDGVRAEVCLRTVGAAHAAEAAERACSTLRQELDGNPDLFLLHATPGFEERVLEGIARSGLDVPVYGGSAADDSVVGRWRVFAQGDRATEGFALVGLKSRRPILSSFTGGYLPTEFSGRVTKAEGRTVYQIDGRPAARVYDEWTQGALSEELGRGGRVLRNTDLLPVARTLGEAHGMPRRLLSLPREVLRDGALGFFSELATGDEITLMTSTKEPLVARVRRAAERARASRVLEPKGGVLIYCAGCLNSVMDRASEIAREFREGAGEVPFVGLASFGEQGTLFPHSASRHGNLMSSVVLL